MRILRWAVLSSFVVVVAWLVAQAVSVDASAERFRITVDRQELRRAGRELTDKGSRALGEMGRALDSARHALDRDTRRPPG